MKTPYTVWYVMIVMVFATLPCEAQDHLLFSRPGDRSGGVAMLMGERILKEAYTRLDTDFEFRELPSLRALATANNGGTDGEFQRLAGLEQTYPNLIMISVAIGHVDIVVYTKEMEFAVEGWHSLAPYSIGFVRGFQLVEAKTEGMHVEAVFTPKQAFLMLNAGRSDVVVDSRSTQCVLKDLNMSGIRILEPPLDQLVLYHYLHVRHADLAVKLEAVLNRMEQEGELKILEEQAMQDFLELCGH
ncbi:substrate-binding periplasmic protein [Desulfosarcina ovata]|uniref:ABC transporter substrate-binding protein n=1 Tax=Desulfosarcina ovata subsp. ovata TaxID=2752305 RepID=A0A5K8AD12_9BACT|nr:ABC transporter substrate-binding protein [Desulfosarcina ovata]BBO90416.1 ABC transporter substrate-binding protein [Desulfosarcina ovata subsp. ovata]